MAGDETSRDHLRSVVYCVVPRDLAPKLHEPLRRYFRGDAQVEVVVEQRGAERRIGPERRSTGTSPAAEERRRIRAAQGRRVDDRRASIIEVEGPPLSRRLERHRARLVFIERLEPAQQRLEDADTARLVARIQSGEADLFGQLYIRYFDRIYGYLCVLTQDRHEAEDLAQSVFLKVFESLDRYERVSGLPFRAWLFTIVRNDAMSYLRKQGRLEPNEPAHLDRRREEAAERGVDQELGSVLDWITDRDLLLFVERLPLAQRQVVVLRYLFGMSSSETAHVLGYTPNQVRKLQQRAMQFLRQRLAAVGRGPTRHERRVRVRVRPSQAYVVRARRFALR